MPRSSPEHSGSSALLIRSGKPRSPNAEYARTGDRSRGCPSHRRTDVPRPSSFPTEFALLVLKGALLCQTKRNPFEGSPDAEQHRVFPCKWRFLISSAEFHVCGRERTVGSPRADLACQPVVASSSVVGHVGWIRRCLWRPFHLVRLPMFSDLHWEQGPWRRTRARSRRDMSPVCRFRLKRGSDQVKQRRACGAVKPFGNATRVCPLNITFGLRYCRNEEHQRGCEDE